MNLKKKLSGPLLVVGLASPLMLVNCNGLPIPGGSCDELDTGNFASFTLEGVAPDVTANIKGFVEASFNLNKLTVDLETDLIAVCGELGKAAGMGEEEVKAEPKEGEGATKVCEAVAAKVKGMLSGAGELKVEIGEPSCYVPIDAMVECYKGCGAAVSPGEFEASCEGGEISGTCEAECKGTCTVEAGAECGGSCGGTCEGKCDGKDSKGSCSGKCEGKCSASCKMEGKADCKGSCSGGCSAEIKAPKCSGEFKPPKVDVSCQMNCTAATAAQATCDPPSVKVTLGGEAGADVKGLVTGIEAAVPKIIAIGTGRAKSLVAVGEGLVKQGMGLKDSIAKLTPGLGAVKAGVCIAGALGLAKSAGASMSGSVSASASVSGSFSAGGSAEAGGG